jgi:hypothetical protein
MNSTLTNQQEKLSGGSAPLPLYAALNVKRKTSAKVFHGIYINFACFKNDNLFELLYICKEINSCYDGD